MSNIRGARPADIVGEFVCEI